MEFTVRENAYFKSINFLISPEMSDFFTSKHGEQ